MFKPVFRVLSATVLTLCMFGAAHAEDVAPAAPRSVVTMVPIGAPEKLAIENRGGILDAVGGVGYVVTKGVQSGRDVDWSNTLMASKFSVQKELQAAIVKELADNGVDLTDGERIKYYEDDPTSIDFKGSAGLTDKILQVKIPEFGLYSGRFSSKFVPKLNVSVDLVQTKNEKYVFSQWFYYGADARKDTDDQATAAPKYSYASFAEAVEKKDELIESYRDGIQKLAHLAVMQLKPYLLKK